MWSSEVGRGSLSDADLVGKGSHSGEWPPMSLCGFDKDIYALPAFMGLGHCGDAYLDLPPPLSRQAGREADIINSSLSSYPTSLTYHPHYAKLRGTKH